MLQSELSAELSIARATTTRALDGLEEKGYIERRRSESDGRETSIFPTREAVRLKSSLNEASGTVTAKLKRTLGSAEFTDTVSKIRGARSVLE
jgi:DNA-binding MarR family transcriptional regulator